MPFSHLLFSQIDAADIIESQHLHEKTQKFENHAKELQSQILILTQKRDDLTAQLEVQVLFI